MKEQYIIHDQNGNRHFQKAWQEVQNVSWYLMHDYFRPTPTTLYVSEEEAVELLTPHYKTAHKMSRPQLQGKLNSIAASEMEKRKVALFCCFCVVGSKGECEEMAFPPPFPEDGDGTLVEFAFGSAQQVSMEKEDWMRMWRRTY